MEGMDSLVPFPTWCLSDAGHSRSPLFTTQTNRQPQSSNPFLPRPPVLLPSVEMAPPSPGAPSGNDWRIGRRSTRHWNA